MPDVANLSRVLRHHPVIAEISGLGLDALLVGGFIRDALLGRTPTDVDIVLSGDYDSGVSAIAEALGEDAFALGDRFQTRRFTLFHGTLDITPLEGSGWEEDLLRRDFTVNAIGLPFGRLGDKDIAGALIDPADGLSDLAQHRIVAVAENNLLADPLRILRAYRFAVQLGFEIEEATASLLGLHADAVNQAAGERIREELFLMLRHPRAHAGLAALDKAGVLTALFPEIEPMRHFKQNDFHHLPVLAHSLEAIRELEHILSAGEGLADDVRDTVLAEMREIVSPPATRASLVKLALLFHDVGKPQTAQVQENGKLTFYGHQQAGREIAEPILERLRLSNWERNVLLLLIEEHLRVGFYCNEPQLTNKLIYRFHRKLGDAATMSCIHALADARATRGPDAGEEFLAKHEEVVNAILWHHYFSEETVEPIPLLTGDQIMEVTGLPEGPDIGRLKEALLEAQVEGTVRDVDEAEAFVRQYAAEGLGKV